MTATQKHTPELLKADRCWCNESEGKEMYGCLAIDEVVECYFPTKSAFDRSGSLFAAAPELLEALKRCITQDGAHCMTRDGAELSEMAMRVRLNVISAIAKSAIQRAEGKE